MKLFFALLLASPAAFAASLPSPETFNGVCDVIAPIVDGQPPQPLATKHLDLKPWETAVIYQQGTLTYKVQYQILGKGDPNYELANFVMTIEDTAKDVQASTEFFAYEQWRRDLQLHIGKNVPYMSCLRLK